MVLVLQSVGLRLKRGYSRSHNFGLRSRSRCQCKAPKQNPKLQNTSHKLHSKLLAFHMLSSICNFEPQKKDHSIMRFGIPRLYWRIMNRREIMPASLPDPWCEMLPPSFHTEHLPAAFSGPVFLWRLSSPLKRHKSKINALWWSTKTRL